MSAIRGEPTRVTATQDDAGRTCPYCRFPLKEGGELMVCGYCHAAHHLDCWTDEGGCAVMGCAGARVTQPTAVPAPVAAAAGAIPRPQPARQREPFTPSPPPYAFGQQPAYAPSRYQPTSPPPPAPGRNEISPLMIVATVLLALAVAGVAVVLFVTNKSASSTVTQTTVKVRNGTGASKPASTKPHAVIGAPSNAGPGATNASTPASDSGATSSDSSTMPANVQSAYDSRTGSSDIPDASDESGDPQTCNSGVYVSEGATSCYYADNVAENYAGDGPVTAYSYARSQPFTIDCTTYGSEVACTGGDTNNAWVFFPHP